MVWRPFYFARLIVDPHEPADRLFKVNFNLGGERRRGEAASRTAAGRSHGDWHDLWINPD